jgi:hypothetical protein
MMPGYDIPWFIRIIRRLSAHLSLRYIKHVGLEGERAECGVGHSPQCAIRCFSLMIIAASIATDV